METGKVRVNVEADPIAQKWLTREKIGQGLINILGLIAYVLCTLWIVDLIF